ncbi:MAG: hypothetical protein V3T83_20470, partial [Acidobacteriota bacterium]
EQTPDALVFGWYKRSKAEVQQEGPHYGTAFLQVAREVNSKRVDTLEAEIELATDWKGGGVDNQFMKRTRKLKIHHPAVPATPIITGSKAAEDLTLTVPGDEVMTLLGLVDTEKLKDLIASGTLTSFNYQNGLEADKVRVTKGSLIDALGVRPTKSASA